MDNITENTPAMWLDIFPCPSDSHHKYDRGHTIILGGAMASTGAAKLAARAALRMGSGLVSVACTDATLPIYAASFQAIMTKLASTVDAFEALIAPDSVHAIVLGPGAGVMDATKNCVLHSLKHHKACVIDADALSVFATSPSELFNAIQGPCVLTPHAGEFARLFGDVGDADQARVNAAVKAAKQSGAIIVLKGSATIIAAPNGTVAINHHASAYLATAGSGDLLAGMIAGLLAQGMPAFEAACAAVWLHGDCAQHFGAGLIAEDLPDILPAAFARLGIKSK